MTLITDCDVLRSQRYDHKREVFKMKVEKGYVVKVTNGNVLKRVTEEVLSEITLKRRSRPIC